MWSVFRFAIIHSKCTFCYSVEFDHCCLCWKTPLWMCVVWKDQYVKKASPFLFCNTNGCLLSAVGHVVLVWGTTIIVLIYNYLLTLLLHHHGWMCSCTEIFSQILWIWIKTQELCRQCVLSAQQMRVSCHEIRRKIS